MNEASVEKDEVLALSRRHGELDGEISYFYGTEGAWMRAPDHNFVKVSRNHEIRAKLSERSTPRMRTGCLEFLGVASQDGRCRRSPARRGEKLQIVCSQWLLHCRTWGPSAASVRV